MTSKRESKTSSSEKSSKSQIGIEERASAHLGLLVSAAALLFVLLKLSRVAQFEPSTSVALIRAAGPVQVLLGSLLVQLPLLLAILFFQTTLWLIDSVFTSKGFESKHSYAAMVLLVLLMVMPWRASAVGVIAGLSYLGYRRFRKPSSAVWPFWSILLVYVALGSQVWLPAEQIRLSSADVLVGYVVSQEAEWTSVLKESERTIVQVRTTQIIGRRVCNLGEVGERTTILDLFEPSARSTHPLCFPDEGSS